MIFRGAIYLVDRGAISLSFSSLLKVRSIASNFDCKGISSVIDSTNVYPQDIAFDCAHIAYECNDRAIQTAESKKSRPSTLLRQESGLNVLQRDCINKS